MTTGSAVLTMCELYKHYFGQIHKLRNGAMESTGLIERGKKGVVKRVDSEALSKGHAHEGEKYN